MAEFDERYADEDMPEPVPVDLNDWLDHYAMEAEYA